MDQKKGNSPFQNLGSGYGDQQNRANALIGSNVRDNATHHGQRDSRHKNQQKPPQQDMRSKSKKKPVIIKKGGAFLGSMQDRFESPKTFAVGKISQGFPNYLKEQALATISEHQGSESSQVRELQQENAKLYNYYIENEKTRLISLELQQQNFSQIKKIMQLNHNDLKGVIGDHNGLTNQNGQLKCTVKKLEGDVERLKQENDRTVQDYQRIVRALYEEETINYAGLAVEEICCYIKILKEQKRVVHVSHEAQKKFELLSNKRQSQEEYYGNDPQMFMRGQSKKSMNLKEQFLGFIGWADSKENVFRYIQALSKQLGKPHKNIEGALFLVKSKFNTQLSTDKDYQLVNKVINIVIELSYTPTKEALKYLVYSLDSLVRADSVSLREIDKDYEFSLDASAKMNEFLRQNKDSQQFITFVIQKIEERIKSLVSKKTKHFLQLKEKYEVLAAQKLSVVEQHQKQKQLYSQAVNRYKTLQIEFNTLASNYKTLQKQFNINTQDNNLDLNVKDLKKLSETHQNLKREHTKLESDFVNKIKQNNYLSQQIKASRRNYQDLRRSSQTDKRNLESDITNLKNDLRLSQQQQTKICREVASALQKTINIQVQVRSDMQLVKHLENYLQRAQYFLASRMLPPLRQSHEKANLIDFLQKFKKSRIDSTKLVYSYDPQNAQYFKYILTPTFNFGNYLLLFKSVQDKVFGIFFENVCATQKDNFGGFVFSLTYGKCFRKRYYVDEKVKISRFQQSDNLFCVGKNELKIIRNNPTQLIINVSFNGYFELNYPEDLIGQKTSRVKLKDVELYQISFKI